MGDLSPLTGLTLYPSMYQVPLLPYWVGILIVPSPSDHPLHPGRPQKFLGLYFLNVYRLKKNIRLCTLTLKHNLGVNGGHLKCNMSRQHKISHLANSQWLVNYAVSRHCISGHLGSLPKRATFLKKINDHHQIHNSLLNPWSTPTAPHERWSSHTATGSYSYS